MQNDVGTSYYKACFFFIKRGDTRTQTRKNYTPANIFNHMKNNSNYVDFFSYRYMYIFGPFQLAGRKLNVAK